MRSLLLPLLLLLCVPARAPRDTADNPTGQEPTDRPDIVIIYPDDLGYGDVGAYGATALETPNMDALANGGVRFTNGYASSATCTPSRYALLGESDRGREALVLEATSRTAMRQGHRMYIPPYPGNAVNGQVNLEVGNAAEPQLYNLIDDPGEQRNLAGRYPDTLAMLRDTYREIRGTGAGETETLRLE